MAPLPSLTVICFMSRSVSWTRSRNASSSRSPLPYNSFTTICVVPDIARITRRVSSLVSTTGTRTGRSARTASIPVSVTPRTCAYRNNKALNAWFCVATATFPFTAKSLKNNSILTLGSSTNSSRNFILWKRI